MGKRDGALLAGAVLLWLLLRRQEGVQGTGAASGTSGVTFPPVVPIGGGQVSEDERSWLERGVDFVKGLARGIRNNNPLNIVYLAANQWVGQTGSDGRYAIFSDAKYGVRAGGKILDSYFRQGFKTIRQIVTRWAPAVENDVESYLAHVLAQTGWGPAYVPARADYPRLVAAMIRHENGSNPYSLAQLSEWLALP